MGSSGFSPVPARYQGDIAYGWDPVKSGNLPVKVVFSYSFSMNLRRKAKEALEEVSDAARTTVDTTQWATVALVCVSAVSLVALSISLLAISVRRTPENVDK
jgi:hypothetical protein